MEEFGISTTVFFKLPLIIRTLEKSYSIMKLK